MIPQTYQAIRQQHPNVPLEADFVTGMRDHSNALAAMLLYMQDTWNGLAASPDVQGALGSGIATQAELVAAGYNSNPTRLPSYLKRGGSEWRTLIPAETQMYLAIYGSLDHLVQLGGATASQPKAAGRTTSSAALTAPQVFSISNIARILPALTQDFLVTSSLLFPGLR